VLAWLEALAASLEAVPAAAARAGA
jgi:hypothetical protein